MREDGLINRNDNYNPRHMRYSYKVSEQRRKRRSCEGKTPYDTELDAYHAAQRRNRDRPVRYSDLGHYNCRYCPKWHIGHEDNRAFELKKETRRNKARQDICRTLRWRARLTLQQTQQTQ